MTRVEKLFSSHFKISQQFFKEDTPGSLVDNADWLLHGQNEFSEFLKEMQNLDWRAMNMRWIQVLA